MPKPGQRLLFFLQEHPAEHSYTVTDYSVFAIAGERPVFMTVEQAVPESLSEAEALRSFAALRQEIVLQLSK